MRVMLKSAALAATAATLFFARSQLNALELAGVQVEADPFLLTTDVGNSPAEERKTAERFLKPMLQTATYFLQVYNLKDTCFDDYAKFYSSEHYESTIRVHIWRKYDDFVADYQKRYETKSIPGAFFGVNKEKDEYGKPTGTWIREIGVSSEGMDDSAVLRDLYHEMGHLFMRTYIVRQVEVPSWIEEGTAQLFQYHKGNGTHPEEERDQREGWLTEMVNEDFTIPWKEMVNVHNLDNLDFTYKDPLRSQVQYVQAWSMIEFMISNDLRLNAFIELLSRFKKQTEIRADELSHQVSSSEEFLKKLQPYLYEVQADTFQKCYGNELFEIESIWKGWIKKEYALDVKKKPILHYYRGDWYMLRAQYPRTGETAQGLLDKASAIFEACITEHPDKPEGYVGRGRIQLSQGKIADAGDSFGKALSLGANNYDALLYGGIARVLSGHCKEAVEPLTKAVTMRPTDAQAQLYLGQALAASGGDLQKAVDHLRAARDKEPKQAPMCAWIEGAAQYMAGHMHEAYISWLRVENLDPNFPEIKIYQSLAMAEDNDRDQAISLLQPIAASVVGKAFLDCLNDSKKPIPKVSFTPTGQPTIDYAAVGLTVTRSDDAGAKAPDEPPKANPASPLFPGGGNK
jgi:tetratricopeptide (TPR) repeat protein